MCTPAPLTMFKGVRKLAPAERMTVSADGTTRSETWWSPMSESAAAEVARMSDDEMEERLMELLRASIRKRMMADVPFGVFLSGGVDSSTNVALMSEEMSQPVETFTVGFRDEEYLNELEAARRIARDFKTNHHEVIISEAEMTKFLPDLVFH